MIWIFIALAFIVPAIAFEVIAYMDIFESRRAQGIVRHYYEFGYNYKWVEGCRTLSAMLITVAAPFTLAGLQQLLLLSSPVGMAVAIYLGVIATVGYGMLRLQDWRNKRAGIPTD